MTFNKIFYLFIHPIPHCYHPHLLHDPPLFFILLFSSLVSYIPISIFIPRLSLFFLFSLILFPIPWIILLMPHYMYFSPWSLSQLLFVFLLHTSPYLFLFYLSLPTLYLSLSLNSSFFSAWFFPLPLLFHSPNFNSFVVPYIFLFIFFSFLTIALITILMPRSGFML